MDIVGQEFFASPCFAYQQHRYWMFGDALTSPINFVITPLHAMNGGSAAVMKMMEHKDVTTAMQYQHPELEIVRTALNRTATGACT